MVALISNSGRYIVSIIDRKDNIYQPKCEIKGWLVNSEYNRFYSIWYTNLWHGVVEFSRASWDRKKNLIFSLWWILTVFSWRPRSCNTELPLHSIAILRSSCWRLTAISRRFHNVHCAFSALSRYSHTRRSNNCRMLRQRTYNRKQHRGIAMWSPRQLRAIVVRTPWNTYNTPYSGVDALAV